MRARFLTLFLKCPGLRLSLLLAGAVLLQPAVSGGESPPGMPFPPPGPGPGPGPRPGHGPGPGKDAPRPFAEGGSALTQEEWERVRQVLADVWNQPEVAGAREAVHQATVAYREAVQSAVAKKDPGVAPLLEKMHRHFESTSGRRRGGQGPGPGGPGGMWPGGGPPPLPQDPIQAVDRLLEHESGMAKLDPAGRKRLLDLAQEALRDPELSELLAAAIRTREPAAEALQARRVFREKLLRAMTERDPWVEQVLKHAAGKERPRGEERRPPQPPSVSAPVPP